MYYTDSNQLPAHLAGKLPEPIYGINMLNLGGHFYILYPACTCTYTGGGDAT